MKNRLSALLLALLAPFSAPAAADPVQSYLEASTRFQQLWKDSAAAGIDPSSQEVAPLLARLTDRPALGAATVSANPLIALMNICDAANAANVSLGLFGLANSGILPGRKARHQFASASRAGQP